MPTVKIEIILVIQYYGCTFIIITLEFCKSRRQILAKNKPVTMQWIPVGYPRLHLLRKLTEAGGKRGRWMHETLTYLSTKNPHPNKVDAQVLWGDFIG